MMSVNPFRGVVFHWLGGLASGSFYVPFRGVKKWSWEVYWLVGGFFSWIIAPWILALVNTQDLFAVLRAAPPGCLLRTYIFGAMWGLGGLTFGLTMRYLGMSLGMGVALGYCAVIGTLAPPIIHHEFATKVLGTTSGLVILIGIVVCILGIAVAGMAGMSKEREMTEEQKKSSIKEFNFFKGLLVATFSGVFSACFAMGLDAAAPLAELSAQRGTSVLWTGLPKLCVVLLGGFTSNFIWCLILNIRNRTGSQYFSARIRRAPAQPKTETINEIGGHAAGDDVKDRPIIKRDGETERAPMLNNYFFSALAGVTWYLQFFFYTMGETQMGNYKFSSWTIHMASIIIFSSLWGIALKEWRGSSGFTKTLLAMGLGALIISTMIVGYGNYLAAAPADRTTKLRNDVPSTLPRPALIPLLWTQGQPPATIRAVVREIAAGGNTGFVWESRPHPDYLGPKWWDDLSVAVDEARWLSLDVWIFDEWMYPSGIAGGKVVAENPGLTHHILRDRSLVADGPYPEKEWGIPGGLKTAETIVSVAAFPAVIGNNFPSVDLSTAAGRKDLSEIRWAVPNGRWRICWVTAAPELPKEGWRMETMIDILNPKAAEAFIRLTHEETYKRFASDFGKTIKGFFSDETGFRNITSYDSLPGKPGMPMPWSPVFLDYFRKAKGYDPGPWLASLWYDLGARGREVRYDLMDAYATAFAEAFFKPQQDWCRRHGVRLIGHLVEDNGADHQLGYGPGHWFRAMSYFDVPGIDIVGYQVMPGLDAGTSRWIPDSGPDWDQEFFQFGLPSMARGAALIKGSPEIFSEAFGAYGWSEGLRMVKEIGDWHFVNGIGILSPHAMTMKYHDPDCPPHFNRTSGNPQWRYYSAWADYAKRIQTLLADSLPVYDAAVLYTAESSWAGPAQSAAPIVRTLEKRLISTVVLPYETWASEGVIKKGRWNYHGQSFSLIVLPSVRFVPAGVMTRLADFAERGGRVVVIDPRPEGSVDGRADGEVLKAVERLERARGKAFCAFSDIGEITAGLSKIRFESGSQNVMISRRMAKEGEWILVHNRSLDTEAAGRFVVKNGRGGMARYDAEQGIFFTVPFKAHKDGLEAELKIPPGAMWCLRLGTRMPQAKRSADFGPGEDIRVEWDVIELDDSGKQSGLAVHKKNLEDWRTWKEWPKFAGTLRYQASLDLPSSDGALALDAGRVGEIAELRVDGRPMGVRLAPPYIWDITEFRRPSRVTIEIDVTNTAHARWPDPFSHGDAACGLLGPVSLLKSGR